MTAFHNIHSHGFVRAAAGAPLLRGMLAGRVYVKWPYLQEAEVCMCVTVCMCIAGDLGMELVCHLSVLVCICSLFPLNNAHVHDV